MTQPGGLARKCGRRNGQSATTVPGPLTCLLPLHLADIYADAVKHWLRPLAESTPTQAAQTYRALHAFMAWCAEQRAYRNVVHADACNRRLARDILPKAKAKTDSLLREQLQGWFQEVRRIGNPVISAYLQALLLTGARREEMAHLRWQDADFQWQSITIRDKVDSERTIPLTPWLASLLSNPPRRNEWVFSSPTAATGRLQEPRINHNKALTAAGLPNISLHGLRRSFSSLTEWIECPARVVAQIMGHKPSATAEKHYKVRPLDLLRMWHTKIEAWMLAQAGIAFQAEQPGLRVVGVA
jgi:integrase